MEIFKLFGRILIDSADAEESIQKTERKASKLASAFGNGIKKAAAWGAGIVGGAVAAGKAVMDVANKAAESADEIDKMSQKIGLSKEAYQEWNYAMGQSGIDISVMQTGVKTLTTLMDSAKEGTASAAAVFDTLGLSIYDSTGALKSQEQMMEEAIMALASMEDSTERARLSTELFGKAGTELEPLLNSGAEGIQELRDRAHELGLVMSDEAVDAGVKFGDTLADVKDSFAMVGTELGTAFMPMLQKLLDWVIVHLPEIKETAGKVMDGIKRGISTLQAFWEKHGDAITEKVQSVMNIIGKVIGVAMDTIGGLIDTAMALISGDWEGAWDSFVGVVTGLGTALYKAGKAIITSLWDGIKNVWSSISNWVSEKVNWLVDKLAFWRKGNDEMSADPSYSHASGLAYVPYDNYPANLHRGEVVLNAADAGSLLDDVRKLAASGGGSSGPMHIDLSINLDGQTLARRTFSYNQREGELRGGSLVGGLA